MKLFGLDHVTLRVRDIRRSIAWYQEVLGLERRFEDKWGDKPAFLVANGSGLALFRAPDPITEQPSEEAIRLLHVAFRVDLKNFQRAQPG